MDWKPRIFVLYLSWSILTLLYLTLSFRLWCFISFMVFRIVCTAFVLFVVFCIVCTAFVSFIFAFVLMVLASTKKTQFCQITMLLSTISTHQPTWLQRHFVGWCMIPKTVILHRQILSPVSFWRKNMIKTTPFLLLQQQQKYFEGHTTFNKLNKWFKQCLSLFH